MHLQSTAIILTAMLSAAQANVLKHKPVDICAHEKDAVVNFEWWINGNTHCIDDGTEIIGPVQSLSGSQHDAIDQTYCYDITSASSYRLWQEERVGRAVTCTFAIYPEYACKGEAVKTSHFPVKESDAKCIDSIIAPGPEPPNDWWPSNEYGLYPFQGKKSVKLSCSCVHPPTSSKPTPKPTATSKATTKPTTTSTATPKPTVSTH